ncbi:MAG: 4Fe-4S binding protein [Deltaproteobacteria bacterium]|nr:4Fe-4S binding protein [Deltaproteobacteria bacterium]
MQAQLFAFLLGFISLTYQLVIVREFASFYASNELIIGSIMACWLLLTGIASTCNKLRINPLALAFILIFYPLSSLIALRFLHAGFFAVLTIDPLTSLLLSLITLLPFCFAVGYSLPQLVNAGKQFPNSSFSSIYAWDSLGSVGACICYSLLLADWFSPLQILSLGSIIILLLSGASFSKSAAYTPKALSYFTLFIFIIIFAWSRNIELFTTGLSYPQQDLQNVTFSQHGYIVQTKQQSTSSVFVNSQLLSTDSVSLETEEQAHYILAQREQVKRMLLVSGGSNSLFTELLKYPLLKIDYLESDPDLAAIIQATISDKYKSRLTFYAEDPYKFLSHATEQYDIIMLALPTPSSFYINRLYTTEFFSMLYPHLSADGIVALRLSANINYLTPEVSALISSIYKALAENFKNNLLLPGSHVYLLASQGRLNPDIAALPAISALKPFFLTPDYLRSIITLERLADLQSALLQNAPVNSNFSPVAYWHYARIWLSQFSQSAWWYLFCALLGGALLALAKLHTKSTVLAFSCSTTSFACLGLSLLLLFSYQILSGHSFADLGLLFGAYLSGSFCGSYFQINATVTKRKQILGADALVLLLSLLLPTIIFALSRSYQLSSYYILLIVAALNFSLGAIQAWQLRAISQTLSTDLREAASFIFALDFLAAALGAFSISALLLPLIGFKACAYVFCSLKVLSLCVLYLSAPINSPTEASPKRKWLGLAFSLAVLALLGALLLSDSTYQYINAFTLNPNYHLWLIALMIAAIVAIVITLDSSVELEAQLTALPRSNGLVIFRWLYFLSFLPALIYPLFRCVFKIPFLFCHVCPQRCVFGHLRPYLIPWALTINLERRKWCYNLCPLGTLQECQAKATKSQNYVHSVLGKFLDFLPYVILALTVVIYLVVWGGDKAAVNSLSSSWYEYFYAGSNDPQTLVIVSVIMLLIIGLFRRRSFCSLLCPAGALSGLLLKMQRLMSHKRRG